MPLRQAEGLPELLVPEEPAWWIFVFTYWCAEEACEKPLKACTRMSGRALSTKSSGRLNKTATGSNNSFALDCALIF
jgi:hypothetical protein